MPKKKEMKFDLRLPSDLAAAAKKKARRLDRPLAQVVRELLRGWVDDPTQGRAP